MYSALVVWPGKKGLLGAMACMVATMSKHIIVDGLIPPPPVMVMTAGVILAVQFAPGEWGKRVFVGYCLLNAATFKFMPLTPLQVREANTPSPSTPALNARTPQPSDLSAPYAIFAPGHLP